MSSYSKAGIVKTSPNQIGKTLVDIFFSLKPEKCNFFLLPVQFGSHVGRNAIGKNIVVAAKKNEAFFREWGRGRDVDGHVVSKVHCSYFDFFFFF